LADTAPEPHVFVIFGSTGDLAKRKLIPALYELQDREDFGHRSVVLGVGRQTLTDDEFRAEAAIALRAAGLDPDDADRWCSACLHYQSVSEGFEALADRIRRIEAHHSMAAENRAFYLALPPQVFEATVTGLAEAGLNCSAGWTRLVVEKPFGHSFDSAVALNDLVHGFFDEEQIYRIDHYLGKDTVQNLLVFRFANALFESAWSRDRIEEVQITVAESLGVEERAGYYDQAGAMRDMVQSHLAQLLMLVAMEPPTRLESGAIRDEKVKVLAAVRPIDPERVVWGQYAVSSGADGTIPGYADDLGRDSSTETFVALELFIDNWRWEGVPFRLRTGKRLPGKATSIAIVFKEAPISLFGPEHAGHAQANVLMLTIQPDEGFKLFFDVKGPGEGAPLRTEAFTFSYREAFGDLPDAYETLLGDVIDGDQTLFVRGDEVERSWHLFDPLLESPHDVVDYEAGVEWGPPSAAQLVGEHGWLGQA
jgi:glucose-6-phosphate 1-dehydrogenase